MWSFKLKYQFLLVFFLSENHKSKNAQMILFYCFSFSAMPDAVLWQQCSDYKEGVQAHEATA